MISNAEIAAVKIAQKQLGMDDQAYRQMLANVAGVESCRDLDKPGFRKVMKHMEACGYRNPNYKPYPDLPRSTRPGMATVGQLKKIYASWWSLAGTGWFERDQELPALRGFLSKKFGASHENFLTFEKAREVIEAIKAIKRRRSDG